MQTGKKIRDVMFDQRREINVIPRLVFAPCRAASGSGAASTRGTCTMAWSGSPPFSVSRADEEVVALVQQLRKRMTGIDRQRREHRKDFLLEVTPRPGGTFRVQLRDVVDADAVLRQERHQLIAPECVLRRDQLMHGALDGVEGVRRRQPVRADIARFAFDLLLDPGDADFEKLVEIRADDGEEFDPLDQRLRRVLRFFQDAAVELEPAQLAVDEIFRRGETRGRRRSAASGSATIFVGSSGCERLLISKAC